MDLKEFKVKQEELEKALGKNAKNILAEEFKSFFAAHPEIDAVRWTQYTPHFNDGEPCIFERNRFDVRIKDNAKTPALGDEQLIDQTEYDDDGFFNGWDLDDNTALGKTMNTLEDLFDDSTQAIFKTAFDDGVQVTVTRKGFRSEEHSHD